METVKRLLTNAIIKSVTYVRKNYLVIIIIGITVGIVTYFAMKYKPIHQMHFNGGEMKDLEADPAVFGTTPDDQERWNNLTPRTEYYGTQGNEHYCKCGYPLKHSIDSMSSNFALHHVCKACDGQTEPEQLGNWWVNKDEPIEKFDGSNIGLDRRPKCTTCGN